MESQMSKIFLLLFFLHIFLLEGDMTNAVHSYGGVQRLPFNSFINHRGPDVKNTLASHIYHHLHLIGHTPFLDKYSIRVGEKASEAIQNAMKGASVFVTIFSPRYAESEWCMGELQFIVESGKPIIPVFYKVSPDDLLMEQENGVYARALQEHANSGKFQPGTLDKWQNAFRNVSDISGYVFSDSEDEGALVWRIATRVSEYIGKPIRPLYDSSGPIVMTATILCGPHVYKDTNCFVLSIVGSGTCIVSISGKTVMLVLAEKTVLIFLHLNLILPYFVALIPTVCNY